MQNNCPKCGGLFIPNFINGELVSQCCSCGYIYNSEDNEDIIKLSSEKAFKNKFNNTKKSIVEKKDKLIVISYLKYIREKRDISQKQIADVFGFAEQRYGTVERNYSAPSVVLISQIAYLLDVNSRDLYKPVKISRSMYNEIRSLKIEKNNIVQSEELKNLICEMESLSDKKCDRYKELKKLYDKQISSAFLKQGELVESGYWEAYLKTKTPEEIEKNIKTLDE